MVRISVRRSAMLVLATGGLALLIEGGALAAPTAAGFGTTPGPTSVQTATGEATVTITAEARQRAKQRAKQRRLAAAQRAAREAKLQRNPRLMGRLMAKKHGWGKRQFNCLDNVWNRESHWNPRAHNASSGAHGIPQAMPGRKMASAGSDWYVNPRTQIRWGLKYIKHRYYTPCGAWHAQQRRGWY